MYSMLPFNNFYSMVKQHEPLRVVCSCLISVNNFKRPLFRNIRHLYRKIDHVKYKQNGNLNFFSNSILHCDSSLNFLRKVDVSRISCARDALLRSHWHYISSCCTYHHQCLHTSAFLLDSRRSKKQKTPIPLKQKIKTEVVDVWKNMTVRELANGLGKDLDNMFEIFSYIRDSNHYNRPSSKIGNLDVLKQACTIAGKKSIVTKGPMEAVAAAEKDKDAHKLPPALPAALKPRPPVITIMGHVDHGKTTLLDTLRDSRIVDQEFGGITQHIGAFQFSLPGCPSITVLDTPGHAAFSAIRSRGAQVTDVAVLVVAADDGVMPQTVESIDHARHAGVPIVVAINKIDKHDADVPRTRRSLLTAGVQLEEDGGEVQAVEVSARLGTNVPQLVEAVLAQAEMLELRADPKGLVEAAVIEANMDPLKGKVATLLVQRGTLRVGAVLVAGTVWGRVKAMYSETGAARREAEPSTPVQVEGWKELPGAGDLVLEVESQRRAREVVEYRQKKRDAIKMQQEKVAIEAKAREHDASYKTALLEKRQAGIRYKQRLQYGTRPKLNLDVDAGPGVALVLKCDVQGSLEAILQVLHSYNSEHVSMNLISSGVGHVTPSDVNLAHTFGGAIYAFNVGVDDSTRALAASVSVEVVEVNIIYRLVEQLRDSISAMMPTRPEEEILGEAEVLEQFLVGEGNKKKKTPVAGCICVKGTLKKKERFRLYREGQLIHEAGPVTSMRHVKSEVESINNDTECGLKFEDTSVRFLRGDRVTCYTIHQIQQETDWHPPGF